jgi:geranylgeranyl diphosphate synthase type II
MLSAGGKRFRPMLLLSVVEAKEPLLIDSALHVAYAIELLHTYSLIHDDLPAMDDAPLRRGHEKLHSTYDEATAILVGDGLNTEAFRVIADAPLSSDIKVECVRLLATDGGLAGMVLGQAIDLHFENKPLSIEKLKTLHFHKTAMLIASSLKMGAVIANYDAKTQNRLYEFGLDLGLLFQMQDDIIDVIQDEQQ